MPINIPLMVAIFNTLAGQEDVMHDDGTFSPNHCHFVIKHLPNMAPSPNVFFILLPGLPLNAIKFFLPRWYHQVNQGAQAHVIALAMLASWTSGVRELNAQGVLCHRPESWSLNDMEIGQRVQDIHQAIGVTWPRFVHEATEEYKERAAAAWTIFGVGQPDAEGDEAAAGSGEGEGDVPASAFRGIYI